MSKQEDEKQIEEGKKFFDSNNTNISLVLENGQMYGWPLISLEEWCYKPTSNGEKEQLIIRVDRWQVTISGTNLDYISNSFAEGNGGQIICRGSRYAGISTAKPYVSTIEMTELKNVSSL